VSEQLHAQDKYFAMMMLDEKISQEDVKQIEELKEK
jgi:hypothetical protein